MEKVAIFVPELKNELSWTSQERPGKPPPRPLEGSAEAEVLHSPASLPAATSELVGGAAAHRVEDLAMSANEDIMYNPITTSAMYNDYYPQNTSADGFENYGGNHIDDRMKARGSSLAPLRKCDSVRRLMTREQFQQNKAILAQMKDEYRRMDAIPCTGDSSDRLGADDLAGELSNKENLLSRIQELEEQLRLAEVIAPPDDPSKPAGVGTMVSFIDMSNQQPWTLLLVGEGERWTRGLSLPISSPVGKALMGRSAGEEVSVRMEGFTSRFHILSVACPQANH